jgi:DNA polymerase I-like protein with 3'-5' exonuclease and polymerase domains
MCINLRDRYENHFSLDEELQLLYALQDLFDHRDMITQNGNFDAHWEGYKDLIRVRNGFDTLLGHHTLYPLLPHSLAFLTSQYTTHPFYKDDIDIYKEGGDIDSFWRYNATDAAITWECARRITKELKEQKLYDFFVNHVMRLDPHLVRSTVDGMLVDQSVKGKVAAGMARDVEAIVDRFQARVQQTFDLPYYKPNLNSNPQMRDLFINKLKCFNTTGSVDKNWREKAKIDTRTTSEARELLVLYDEYQREAKFFSTYAEMNIDGDNRFRPVWKQQGTTKAPGRLSSAGNLWGTASNAQNQPERSHEFYISDPGTVVIYIDGSQAEARVVAYVANIQKWKEDFERARLTGTYDAHRALASDMYKVVYDDVPTEDWETDPDTGLSVPTLRYKAKRCRHGLNYRMMWPKLAETAGLGLYEAKKSYIFYHNTTPEIRLWWQHLERRARKERELWTPMGRRLKLMQRLQGEDTLESIVAFVPQSTIGDLLRRVWYQSVEDDGWDNSRMRIKLNVHDALIGIAKPQVAKHALRIMKKHLETPIMIEDVYQKTVEPCIIPGDVKISIADKRGIHRWSTLKKLQEL